MTRHDSNRPVLLWWVFLVLPILALALYLLLNTAPVRDVPEQMGKNSVGDESLMQQPVVSKKNTTHGAPLTNARETTELDERVAPLGLDPESARTAVQQVENGVYEHATAMFEQESVDVEWAGRHEHALREMFSLHHGLQRVSINSINCHASMCRIEVFTPRDIDADFFTSMFYDGLANFRDGELKAEAAITRRMEQGMTSVYVAREDHTLGFY